MHKILKTMLLAVALCAVVCPGMAAEPKISPAIDGIFAAFKAHPLVGLGDAHDLAQEEDFYAALVRDPRFAGEVGNVVVEFGDAAHQDIIDRYVDGEPVSYADLRKVWTDEVGPQPTFSHIGYANFFAQVRATNLVLPPQQRIRVWLGDPPIDWSKVESKADWLPFVRMRDTYPAELIKREILAKRKKALVIYGTLHFYKSDSGPITSQIKDWVEAEFPNSFFTVTPYVGASGGKCTFERSIAAWPVPALATPVRGTSLEAKLRGPGCRFTPDSWMVGGPPGSAEAKLAAQREDEWSGVAGDSLLYLGPAHTLTQSPLMPDVYLDQAYRAEMDRRTPFVFGEILKGFSSEANPAGPVPYHLQ